MRSIFVRSTRVVSLVDRYCSGELAPPLLADHQGKYEIRTGS